MPNYVRTKRAKLLIGIIVLFMLFQIYKFFKVRITSIDLPKGKIVFSSNIDGDREIYTMNINGTALKQLTKNSATKTNTATDNEASFSPDGKKIVFVSRRQGDENRQLIYNSRGKPIGEKFSGGTFDIYIMNSNGRNQVPLTYNTLSSHPFFSPDAEKIIFRTLILTDRRTLVKMINIDGSGERILNAGGQIKFSADGKKIFDTFQADLSIMDVDGANRVRLTNLLASEENNPPEKRKMHIDRFDFSSDGKKIAFVVRIDKGMSEGEFYNIVKFYTMNIDGSGLEEIYKIDCSHLDELYISDDNERGRFCDIRQIQYSPDNKSIIFLADFIYKKGIYLLNLQDRTVKELTQRKKNWRKILDFAFTPDGKRIVFIADIYRKDYALRAVILRNIKTYINYFIFRKQTPYYDNKYICIMDINGENYRRIAKLPIGSELGRDFVHWEK